MILFFTIISSLIFIIYFIRIFFRYKFLRLFPIYNISIVLTNGVGIPFVKYFNSYYNFPDSQDIQKIALANIIIFMFVCLLFQLIDNYLYKKRNYEKENYFDVIPRVNYSAYYFLLLIAIFGFIRFVFISNAFQYMGIILAAPDHAKYYYLRSSVSYLIMQLPGTGLATICIRYLNYLLIFVTLTILIRSNSSIVKIFNFIIVFFLLVSTLIITAIFAHRSMVAFLLLYTLCLVAIFLRERRSKFENIIFGNKFKGNRSKYKSLLLSFFTLLVSVGLVSRFLSDFTYMESDNQLSTGLITLFERLMIVPAGTNNYYYELFPDTMPFRGILYSLDPFDLDFYADIAEYHTGYRFGANVFFVATAYTGSGFLGVFLVSIAYCTISLYQDSLIYKIKNSRLNIFFLSVNIPGVLILSSTSIFSSILFGFFSPTLLLFSCFRKPRQVSKTVTVQRFMKN
jgi:hypothetical protein